MKRKCEVLEILGNNVEGYCTKSITSIKEGKANWFEVIVSHVDYVQIKRLLEEILCIEPIDENTFRIVFSMDEIID